MIGMEVYNAANEQKCAICNFTISHNKQGRFTSHLLKEHNLTLNEYLSQYFYSKDELKCQYELCDNLVKLRRGIPNRYCSFSCANKGTPLICQICEKKFDGKHRATKTCSDKCENQLRSKRTKEWHSRMSDIEKERHFTNIITKTAKTRKMNGTPSWNSGKTGIYSDETIEKIRQATLKQLKSEIFRKTSIEKKVEQFLLDNNIAYSYPFILDRAQFDFRLFEKKILIECDGDYRHGNPKFYKNLTET